MTNSITQSVAWQCALSQKTTVSSAGSDRPHNYKELWDQFVEKKDPTLVWGDFLHEAFSSQSESLFAEEPPTGFPPSHRALLAGVAEFLSDVFDIPAPAWIEKEEYFLPEVWDPIQDLLGENATDDAFRKEMTQPAFLRRNVVFNHNSLVSL